MPSDLAYLVSKLLKTFNNDTYDEVENKKRANQDKNNKENDVVLRVFSDRLKINSCDVTSIGHDLNPALKCCLATKNKNRQKKR